MSLAAGTKLGPYEILAPLGAGGMGEVYRGRDTRLGRTIAVKVLPSTLSANHELRERFEREAKIISQLNHPHICALFDVGRQDAIDYLVMEYLEGQTLETHLNAGPLAVMEVLDIGIEVADALEKAHREGITHRDLKPANVMLTESGVKLLDFGVAAITEPPDEGAASGSEPTSASLLKTKPGDVVGTVSYMSPEQLRAQRLDHRTDIWSFGVLLYQMTSGRLPFDGPTASDIISAILLKEPQPLPSDRLAVPFWLVEIVQKALQKDCERRFQAVQDILAELRRYKRKLEIEAEIEQLGQLTPIPQSVRPGGESPSAVAPRPHAPFAGGTLDAIKRYKLLLMVGGSIAAVAAIGTISMTFSLTLLVATGCAIAAYAYYSRTDSLAVMPFEWVGAGTGLAADPEHEYLADGITESIINAMSRLENLKVIARTSVFRYKGRKAEPEQIRRELDVRKILTGRIVQRASNLAVSVELVDAVDNKHVWGEHYERPLSNLAQLSRDIASEISRSLRGRWAGGPEIPKAYSPKAECYQAYLKGKFHLNKRTEDELRKAIECFREVVAMDPNYALAYAGLADSYLLLGIYSSIPLRDAYSQAKLVALKALELDDSLAEAHAILAVAKAGDEWELQGALRELAHAIELNPSYATAHQWYAEHLVCVGRTVEAIAESRRARELDPMSWPVSVSAGVVLLLAREYDKAINQLRITIETDRNHYYPHIALRDAYLGKDIIEEAIAEEQVARKLAGEEDERAEAVGRSLREAYSLAGPIGYWQKRLEFAAQDLERPSHLPYDIADSSPYHVAIICAQLGQRDQAVKWIEKAYEERDYYIYFLKANPAFDSFQTDPRVVAVLRRIGLAN